MVSFQTVFADVMAANEAEDGETVSYEALVLDTIKGRLESALRAMDESREGFEEVPPTWWYPLYHDLTLALDDIAQGEADLG